MLGIITGSGLYELPGLSVKETINLDTEFGNAQLLLGELAGQDIAYISRHGDEHEFLPNMINHRANIFALREAGVEAIVGTTVVGVIDPAIELGKLIIFDDLFFPDNRLPSGEACTFFNQPKQENRAHLIFSGPFSSSMREIALKAAKEIPADFVQSGTYGHVTGPRFGSKAEVRWLSLAGVTAISQTCGPEAILACELGFPYLLIGFGIDFANGVKDEPTPIAVLNENLALAKVIVPMLLATLAEQIDIKNIINENFLYSFD